MKSKFKLLAVAGLVLRSITSSHAAVSVTQMDCGAYHTVFLRSDGSFWAAGRNDSGQLGDGTYSNRYSPVQVLSNGVTTVAAGENFSLFIKANTSLWGTGSDGFGQLGPVPYLGSTNQPELLASNVLAVSAGGGQTLFRTFSVAGSPGHQTITIQVLGMGDDAFGELGNNSTKTSNVAVNPIVIDTEVYNYNPYVAPVAAGGESSFFGRTDGSLLTMGDNRRGQLGDGTTNTPPATETVPGAVNVSAVSIKGSSTLFLESDGSLWAMGDNSQGAVGVNSLTGYYPAPQEVLSSNVTGIAAGYFHNLFLKADGSLWGMGFNALGELGTNNMNTNIISPRQIASNVVNFAAGRETTFYTKSDGTTWAMGEDDYGQLGDGYTSSAAVPEQIFPVPAPIFTSVNPVSRTNLQFTATCPLGGAYVLLAGTNSLQALNLWIPVLTNLVAVRGANNFTATITNGINPAVAEKFYALQKQ